MIPFADLKDGVKHCLNNGKRLQDDAKLLHDNKKFISAIPLYIIAYEELNKGFFLEDFLYKGEDISNHKQNEIFSPRSHITKLRIQYELKRKMLADMSDIEFNSYGKTAKEYDQVWWGGVTRTQAVASCDTSLILLKKFNELKKKFLYIDYKNNKWISLQHKFNNKLLSNLCNLLNNMCHEISVQITLYLESHNNQNISLTDFRPTTISNNQTYLEYQKILKSHLTPKWLNIVRDAKFVLNNI